MIFSLNIFRVAKCCLYVHVCWGERVDGAKALGLVTGLRWEVQHSECGHTRGECDAADLMQSPVVTSGKCAEIKLQS